MQNGFTCAPKVLWGLISILDESKYLYKLEEILKEMKKHFINMEY